MSGVLGFRTEARRSSVVEGTENEVVDSGVDVVATQTAYEWYKEHKVIAWGASLVLSAVAAFAGFKAADISSPDSPESGVVAVGAPNEAIGEDRLKDFATSLDGFAAYSSSDPNGILDPIVQSAVDALKNANQDPRAAAEVATRAGFTQENIGDVATNTLGCDESYNKFYPPANNLCGQKIADYFNATGVTPLLPATNDPSKLDSELNTKLPIMHLAAHWVLPAEKISDDNVITRSVFNLLAKNYNDDTTRLTPEEQKARLSPVQVESLWKTIDADGARIAKAANS